MRQPQNNNVSPILHNPVALGGLAAVAIVVVVATVVVLMGGGNSSGSSDSDTSARTTPAAKTPTKQESDVLEGLTGKATSTINVRSGPGNGYVVLGVLRRSSEVSIVGQSDLAGVAIATPETLPMADVPTYEAVATVPAELTPEVTPTVPSTPAPALPDLAVSGSLVSGGVLVVTVTNQGTGALAATAVDVGIFDVSGSPMLNSTTASVQALAPGASIDIRTGYLPLGGPPQVLVIVDPNGKIAETDDTNNRLTVTRSPGVTPTATKTPHP